MLESLRQTWLVLALAIVLGGALAAVDRALQPRIDAHATQRLQRAVLQVVPQGVHVERVSIEDQTLYRVTRSDGQLQGWAIVVEGQGFVDEIQGLVGLSADGQSIVGLVVLASRETPGLGDRIRDDRFTDQFVGQVTEERLSVTKSDNLPHSSIHAVTGATVSSLAITDAVNAGVVNARHAIQRHAAGDRSGDERSIDR